MKTYNTDDLLAHGVPVYCGYSDRFTVIITWSGQSYIMWQGKFSSENAGNTTFNKVCYFEPDEKSNKSPEKEAENFVDNMGYTFNSIRISIDTKKVKSLNALINR